MPQKKRKLHPLRMLLILAALGLFSYGCYLGIRTLVHTLDQNHKKEEISAKIQEARDVSAQIASISFPSSLTPDSVAKLQSTAKSELASYISALLPYLNQELTNQSVQEALSLESPAASYKTVFDNLSWYPQEYIDFFNEDSDRLEFLCAYLSQEPFKTPPSSLNVSLSEVPLLIQWDTSWGFLPFMDSILAFNGTEATALSAISSYLLQNQSITPYAVADLYNQALNDEDVYYDTLDLKVLAASAYGLNMEEVELDTDFMDASLNQGQVLLCKTGSYYSDDYLVVSKKKDGSIKVLDPDSYSRSQADWDLEDVLAETVQIWAFY